MDKRTSVRLAKLAGRVVKDGVCTPAEAKRLAGCVLAQVMPSVRPKAPSVRAKQKA
jgi:hypothetical protein